jgi:hypothetical protein
MVAMTCAFTLGAIPGSSFILGRVVIAYSRRNAE